MLVLMVHATLNMLKIQVFFILNLNYWDLKLKNVGQYCHFIVSTAKDKGEKKLFGFAFTPLMREDGTTLSDESHELYVYKVRTVSTFTIKTHCVFVINAKKNIYIYECSVKIYGILYNYCLKMLLNIILKEHINM